MSKTRAKENGQNGPKCIILLEKFKNLNACDKQNLWGPDRQTFPLVGNGDAIAATLFGLIKGAIGAIEELRPS